MSVPMNVKGLEVLQVSTFCRRDRAALGRMRWDWAKERWGRQYIPRIGQEGQKDLRNHVCFRRW